ncbi:E3 ubiquitin-protein transferase MAEA [Halotydeus destructor]|nr:E3 ubiquitin-protein transferase MAEA [Halotydeus destructor]
MMSSYSLTFDVARLSSFADAAIHRQVTDFSATHQSTPTVGQTISAPGTMTDIQALEHPTLKVPYEMLNKRFRSAQKNVDREVSHVQIATNDIEKCLNEEESSVENINALLSGVIDKLTILKRKADESLTDELETANVCKRRIDHLKEYCTKSSSNSPVDGTSVALWRKKRLDRMLVEHSLRCGYYDVALKLGQHSDIVDLTNIDLFLVSKQVEQSLIERRTSKCLLWCHDNKSKLRKMKSSLEFNIRQQEFIELVREGKRMEAIKHARKHFSSVEKEHRQELEHVMGLLAFGPETLFEPYKSLFDRSRWNNLIDQFRQENFKLYQLSSASVFSSTLQSGLSALKTSQCYRRDGQKTADCPVCSPLLNTLATSLPGAHCSQSRLICYMSGQPLNEYNHPMMLPNGCVYGETSLKQMVASQGRIVCPRTLEPFSLSDAVKVFVM